MPLHSPSLLAAAQASERCEHDAWADIVRVAGQVPACQAQVRFRRAGTEGLAFSAPQLPLTLFNRVLGLGRTRPAVAQDLAGLAEFFAPAPPGKAAVQPAPGPYEEETTALLQGLGFTPLPQRMVKMARDLRALPGDELLATGGLRVSRVAPGVTSAFPQVIVRGMGLPPWFGPWLEEIVFRPGWFAYTVERDGEAIAAAAMMVREQRAWLGLATTLPHGRRLGAHRLLMARRLADATLLGCEWACTETGDPQPGEAHPSYSNMLGSGFERVATRLSWVWPHAPA